MAAILGLFIQFAPLIYIVLILVALFGLRWLIKARSELRGSAYGLEREIAHRRMSQALSILVVVGFLASAEFILVFFLVPNIPALSLLDTPTINPLSTPASQIPLQPVGTIGPGTPGSTPTLQTTGCIPGQIGITFPKPGDQIQGQITLLGSANIPNFGFYKYEFKPIGSDNWAAIVANNKVVLNSTLGNWDTTAVATGDYLLRLVVTDNQGNELPACIVPIRIKGH
jgi:hypothetical protein